MLPTIRKRSVLGYRNPLFDNDLLSSFFSDGADYTVPAVNIKENDKSFEIEIAAPGLNKDDIQVKIENDVLSIVSEKKNENKENDEHFTRREFSYSSFSRSFIIPDSVNIDKIKANHKNGILTVELPKIDEKVANKSKMIKIS